MLCAFEKEQWFQSQSKSTKKVIVQTKVASTLKKIKFPDELHLISYMYHKELKNNSGIVIPSGIIPYLDTVHCSESLLNVKIPEHYKEEVDLYLNSYLEGTQYLNIYSVPKATFFLTIDASNMIGRFAPINIMKKADSRINKRKQGKIVPQGNNIIKTPLEKINPTAIKSSKEIDLLFSWIGGHNYITGELMNVSPTRGLIRMTYAEPPIIFLDAIDSMRHVEEYINPISDIKAFFTL